MSTYKQIHGTNIDVLSSDPSNPVDGQVWYNSTSNTVKANFDNPGSWATGGDLNTARYQLAGAGIQTAGLVFGGFDPAIPIFGYAVQTESYNGTSWTEVNDLNTPANGKSRLAGAGIQTSALAFGGEDDNNVAQAVTESWNGTSWTEVNDLNTAREKLAGMGSDNTSALATGGTPATSGETESWNGTSWTEVNDLNTARQGLAGTGIQTAALAFGGEVPPQTGATETWNGTSWTEVNDLNTARQELAGTGTQTAALAFGGDPSVTGKLTESWNGTSWTEVNDLNTPRYDLTGAGTQTAALAVGGQSPAGGVAATEEWNIGPLTITFTDS